VRNSGQRGKYRQALNGVTQSCNREQALIASQQNLRQDDDVIYERDAVTGSGKIIRNDVTISRNFDISVEAANIYASIAVDANFFNQLVLPGILFVVDLSL
jgi:hypothetical protein